MDTFLEKETAACAFHAVQILLETEKQRKLNVIRRKPKNADKHPVRQRWPLRSDETTIP